MIIEKRCSGWTQKRWHRRREEEQKGQAKGCSGSRGDCTDNGLPKPNGAASTPKDAGKGDSGDDGGSKSPNVPKENPATRQSAGSPVLPHKQPANEKTGAAHTTSQPANEKSGPVSTHIQPANDRVGVLLSPSAQKTTYNPITHAPSKLHNSCFTHQLMHVRTKRTKSPKYIPSIKIHSYPIAL